MPNPTLDPPMFGYANAICLSRAILRGVYLAEEAPDGLLPNWRSRFGQSRTSGHLHGPDDLDQWRPVPDG
jgi:D-aminopeptidase